MDDNDDDNYRFNDDLLISPEDQRQAQKMFPTVFHVLNHPELQALFKEHDKPSNDAKKKSRRFGLTAIFLAVIALLLASAEPLYRSLPQAEFINSLAASFGIVAMVIGFFGVLFARQKREWLENRLMTERLRQFHFQTMVARWPDVVQSFESDKSRKEYTAKRQQWFKDFQARFASHLPDRLKGVIEKDSDKDCWLYDAPEVQASDDANNDAAVIEMLNAYRKFRILDQIDFAEIKLRKKRGPFGFWSLRRQAIVFSHIAMASILGVFVLHIWIAGGSALKWGQASPWLHVGVIWLAIAALAIRALEEGLQPEREIERYRHYGAAVEAVRERFDQGASTQKKLEIMKEMERVSFDEMRIFLRSNNEARFVL